MSDKIMIVPGDVRGGGNIVDPKSLSDYSIESSKVVNGGSETIDNLSRNIISLQYLGGSYLYIPNPITFVKYISGLTSFSLDVILKYHTGNNITSSPVQCIVNNGAPITENTNSSGIASFTIPVTNGVSIYDLKFIYSGNSNVAGCVLYHRVFVGDLTSLDLTSIPVDICQNEGRAHLIATLTGSDVRNETVGVPNQVVHFWEQYTPGILIKASRPVIRNNEETIITSQLIDVDDGSHVCLEGQNVKIYEEYTPGISVVIDKPVIVSEEIATITAQLIDVDDGSHVCLEGQNVKIYEEYTPGMKITGPSITCDGDEDITLIVELLDTFDGSRVSLADKTIEIYENYHPNLTVINENEFMELGDDITLIAALLDDDGSGIDGETVNIYEEYEPAIIVGSDEQIIGDGETATIKCQLIDINEGSRLNLPGETIAVYQEVDEILYFVTLQHIKISANVDLITAHISNQLDEDLSDVLVEFHSDWSLVSSRVRTNSSGNAAIQVHNPIYDNYWVVTLPEIYGNTVVADIDLRLE